MTCLPNIWVISQNRGIYIRFWISRLTQWARAWYKQKPSRMSTSTKRSLKDFDCINNLPVKASFSIFIVVVFLKCFFSCSLKRQNLRWKEKPRYSLTTKRPRCKWDSGGLWWAFLIFYRMLKITRGYIDFFLSSLCDCSKKVTLHSQIIIAIRWLT